MGKSLVPDVRDHRSAGVVSWDRSQLVELQLRAACRDANPLDFDESDPTSSAAREAMKACVVCPVRELCELVLLHEQDGARTRFTGVAAGAVWLNGKRVETRRHKPASTFVHPATHELTEWLRDEGDPAELREQHKRWQAGQRDDASRDGERAYQRARARMKRVERKRAAVT